MMATYNSKRKSIPTSTLQYSLDDFTSISTTVYLTSTRKDLQMILIHQYQADNTKSTRGELICAKDANQCQHHLDKGRMWRILRTY